MQETPYRFTYPFTYSNQLPQLLWAFRSFAFLIVIAMCGAGALAQSTQGSVLGTIKDSKGAVVPGAVVTLTNTDEGASRTTRTSGNGEYAFSDAKAAHYNIEVEAPGFEKWEIQGIVLEVRQQLRQDVALTIGTIQQEVTVNADTASAIETDNPTISGTFTSDDANNLPVNTRASFNGTSAAGILGTMPGVQDDASGISLQGALPFETEVTVDGVTLKNATGGTFISDSFPSTEAIAEIRADGVLAGAEYSDPGQIVVTTKGGTNLLHGSAFGYYQDSKWDAIAYTYPTTTTKPDLHGATFGGSVGGPVVFPHFYNGHNKTFFFGDFEAWRHPAQTTLFEVVPSTLMVNGDFSKYSSTTFTGLTDPFTGASWGTSIPTGSISAIAMNTLKQFYPSPNVGDPTA